MQPQNEMDTENSVNIIMFYFTLSKFFSFTEFTKIIKLINIEITSNFLLYQNGKYIIKI